MTPITRPAHPDRSNAKTAATRALPCIALAGLLTALGAQALAQTPLAATPSATPTTTSQPAPTNTPSATPVRPNAEHGAHRTSPHPMRGAAQHAERLAQLKAQLRLSPDQEPAWNAFQSAMQAPTDRQRPDRATLAQLTTPERIDHLKAHRAQRIADMDQRADATKAFYARLTPDQKKTFDAQTLRHGAHHGRDHGGGHRS